MINASVGVHTRCIAVATAIMSAIFFSASHTKAQPLRVGKSVPEAFSFIPVDVGLRNGIFKKHGIEIESSAFTGGARLQQALTADSIDIGLGSGPEMASIEKGSPVKAVAAMAGPPPLLALAVRPDGAIRTADDLKGK